MVSLNLFIIFITFVAKIENNICIKPRKENIQGQSGGKLSNETNWIHQSDFMFENLNCTEDIVNKDKPILHLVQVWNVSN